MSKRTAGKPVKKKKEKKASQTELFINQHKPQNQPKTMNQSEFIKHMLSMNAPYNETAYDECKRINVFSEYNALKDKTLNEFDTARFLILRATVKMVEYDPINGDMKPNMTEEDKIYWTDIEKDFVDGGKLLYKFDKMEGMHDGLVWSFLPQRFHRNIDVYWNGIGEWKS